MCFLEVRREQHAANRDVVSLLKETVRVAENMPKVENSITITNWNTVQNVKCEQNGKTPCTLEKKTTWAKMAIVSTSTRFLAFWFEIPGSEKYKQFLFFPASKMVDNWLSTTRPISHFKTERIKPTHNCSVDTDLMYTEMWRSRILHPYIHWMVRPPFLCFKIQRRKTLLLLNTRFKKAGIDKGIHIFSSKIRQTGISDLDHVFAFHSIPLKMYEVALRYQISMDLIPADKVPKKTQLDWQKRFPIYHVCPKCLAALLCGSAFLQNGWTFLQELDEVGMTLVDW